MNKIILMFVVTISFFLLSSNIFFPTNVYLDVLMVLLYLFLVTRLLLQLDNNFLPDAEQYILREHKTAYFVPLIFMPFLGYTYQFGALFFGINVLVIVLLYLYTFILTKRNKLTLTSNGVSIVYLNNKKSSMLFSDVSSVEFNWVYNYIALLDSNGNKLMLDITFKDYLVVIDAIKEKLPKEMTNYAFKKLSIYYKVFLLHSNITYLN